MAQSQIPLQEWVWDNGATRATRSTRTVLDFLQQPDPWKGRFRILSVPRDVAAFERTQAVLNAYLAHHDVPEEFSLEGKQSVNYSFGYETSDSGHKKITWMRLVSKSLGIKYDVASQNPRIDNPVISLQDNRIDSAWFNFAFVLIEEQGAGFPDLRSTLLCFGTVSRLHEAFDALALSDIQLNDPYFVFVPVLRSIWRSIDDVSWLLADVFREVEKKTTVRRTAPNERGGTSVDFAELHDISKHEIYLSEATEAAQLVAKDMIETYRARCQGIPPPGSQAVERKLLHSARMFKATHLRLASLGKRIANITSLAFNSVTQEDSRSMHTIALITLVFLPSTLVAAVFGSSFFDFDMDDEKNSITHISPLFWMFWVISVPVTVVVVLLWWKMSPKKWIQRRKHAAEV